MTAVPHFRGILLEIVYNSWYMQKILQNLIILRDNKIILCNDLKIKLYSILQSYEWKHSVWADWRTLEGHTF